MAALPTADSKDLKQPLLKVQEDHLQLPPPSNNSHTRTWSKDSGGDDELTLQSRTWSKDSRIGVESSSSRNKKVQHLHDFTQEFVDRGYYDEYASWRNSYLRWRKGEAKGAKGENADEQHQKVRKANAQSFEYWYPTVSTFEFRRTISYWVGVFFMEGCLLFLWAPFFHYVLPEARPRVVYYLCKLPTLIGTTTFGVGIYLGYFELINMDTDVSEDRFNYLWCDFRALLKLLAEEHKDSDSSDSERDEEQEAQQASHGSLLQPVSSVAGWLSYIMGGLLYQIANTVDMWDVSEFQRNFWIEWPLVLGGVFFFLGGVCEVIHNRIWASPPTTFVWWTSVFNFTGGFGFWMSACPNIVGEHADAVVVVSTLLYFCGSVWMLCMWRGEQFGMALISNLNRVQRKEGTQIAVRSDPNTNTTQIVPMQPGSQYVLTNIESLVQPQLTRRALMFVLLCVLCTVLQILNTCEVLAAPWEFEPSQHAVYRRLFCEISDGFISLSAVHMVLAFNSACLKMPSEEPYHALTLMMRFTVFLVTIRNFMSLDLNMEDEHLRKVSNQWDSGWR
eukprot:TRINITY_DN35325_c0_g1_i1.p1 TRINITY_DN35325_c0_g1~~TRINITY_DN35325_c0_g1_i1.p1  ORF type:complete len:560 (+),score=82.50 TRINITY_DN35325_c0_g1_i1:161-1840(+)